MRMFHLALTVMVLFLALIQLPVLWREERDLGVMSAQSLQANGASKIAALPIAERNELIKREMAVLRATPLDNEAHQALAILSLLPPLTEPSRELVLNLARYSTRNPAMQIAAVGVLLEKKKLPETMYRIDAVLRSTPALSEQLFPLIAQNFNSKEGVKTIVTTLAERPLWRTAFLKYLAAQPTFQNTAQEVLRELRKTRNPATAIELRAIFAGWIKDTKSYEKSYFVWLDQLSTDELRLAKGIYDGEFSVDPKQLYFDWNVSSSRNGRASIVLKPGSGVDRSLLVDFVGNKEPFSHVSQYTQLFPGKYQFSFDVMSKNITAEAGLVWRILCIEKNVVVGESNSIKTASPWVNMRMAFEIPEQDCNTQIVRLETKARKGLDTAINGQIYFDSFAIIEAVADKLQ